MALQSYRELEVWQIAIELTQKCYEVTRMFPKEELFGLVSQIRRASVSVAANIAEGQGRQHTREFLHHISIARGSLMELETHLVICQRVGLINVETEKELLGLTDRISRTLSKLRQSLEHRLETQ